MATVVVGGGVDARQWDEESYRRSLQRELELKYGTVYKTMFAPSPNPHPETLVVASEDGSISAYSIPYCVSSACKPIFGQKVDGMPIFDYPVVEPFAIVHGHKGAVFDIKFYGDGDDSLLLSCGDDGHIRGWRYKEIFEASAANQGSHLIPILNFVNPQHEGPWNSLSSVPENNAIAADKEDGTIFSAAGDGCAYCWDVERGESKMVFKGHADYLHCIVARKSARQVITGSEDGTTRIWDCRSGSCTQVIYPGKRHKIQRHLWVGSIAIDSSENWLVCGTSQGLSVWNLLSCECLFSIDSQASVQDLLLDNNQILSVVSQPVLSCYNLNGRLLSQIQCAPPSAFSVSRHSSGVTAVGGCGNLVDVISEFGSHLCVFRNKGLRKI